MVENDGLFTLVDTDSDPNRGTDSCPKNGDSSIGDLSLDRDPIPVCEQVLQSTMYPLGLESESESGNINNPLQVPNVKIHL